MRVTVVTSFVAASYVRDLERSRAFYEALGFVENSVGRNEFSAWSAMNHNGHRLLLATSQPPMEIPALPLHCYFFVEDLAAASAALEAAGHPVEHMGYPPHAPGGEARTLDPDGNTILIGQPARSASQPEVPDDDPSQRFSLLREAAALAQHRAGANRTCEIHDLRGRPCPKPAEVKLADAWGDTAWACIPHAEEALITASGAFIANQEGRGLEAFLASRRAARDS